MTNVTSHMRHLVQLKYRGELNYNYYLGIYYPSVNLDNKYRDNAIIILLMTLCLL